MSAAVLLGIGVLGGLGAVARFMLDGAVTERVAASFPWGTLAVNASGAFVLGLLVGAALHGDAYRLAATGLLGGYTTFSTWMLETHRLAEDGRGPLGLLNVAASLAIGLAAAALGRAL
jgi:CrcB protein